MPAGGLRAQRRAGPRLSMVGKYPGGAGAEPPLVRFPGFTYQRDSAASSASRAATQSAPSAVISRFQNGARDFR